MHKFVVLYYRVDDYHALDTFFASTHLRLLEQMPGLREVEVSRIQAKPGGQSRFYLMVEGYFDDKDALQTALISEPGLALVNALRPWAEERLIAWYYADVMRDSPPG